MGDRNREVDNNPHYKGLVGFSKVSSTLATRFTGDSHPGIVEHYPTLGKAHTRTTEEEEIGDDDSQEAMIVPDSQLVAAELDRAAALLRKPDSDISMRDSMNEQRSSQTGGVDGSQTLEVGGEGDDADKDEFAVTLADPGIGKPEGRVYRQGVWSLNESIVLLDAKKREREILLGSKRNSISADEKWKAVAEFCWSHGVHRSKEQCRFKWENTMPDFKKVRDYEYEKADTEKSYFELENWQRKEKHLPPNLSKELYTIMDSFHAGGTSRRTVSSAKKEVREKAAAKLGVSPLPEGLGDLTQESVAAESSVDPKEKAEAAAAGAAAEVKQLADEKATREAEGKAGRRKRRRVADTKADETPKVEPQAPKAAPPPERVRGEGSVASDMTRQPGLLGVGRGSGDAGTATTATNTNTTTATTTTTTTGMEGMRVEGSTQASAGGRDSTVGEARRDSVDKMRGARQGLEDDSEGVFVAAAAAAAKEARVGGWSAEDRKEARHRELVALEREKLVANKEAMGLVATALNNVATAVVRMADMLHQR